MDYKSLITKLKKQCERVGEVKFLYLITQAEKRIARSDEYIAQAQAKKEISILALEKIEEKLEKKYAFSLTDRK